MGAPARDVVYRVRVEAAGADAAEVEALLRHTNTVAEVQNTLWAGVAVRLGAVGVGIVPASSAA